MAKKASKCKILSALLIGGVLCSSVVAPAYAGSEDKVYPSISPVKTHVELNPGDTYSGYFVVGNNGGDSFNYTVYADPYQETDEYGSVNYSERNNFTQIVDWITFETTEGNVAPGETDTINYTINVPEDAPAGGQYAALIAEAKNDEDSGGVQINTITRVSDIIYAQVAGETRNCSKILSNDVNTFMFEPPILATSLIENCGNVDTDASFTIRAYTLFGNEIYTTENNPLSTTILPGTRRFTTASWTVEEGAPMIGIYNIEQTVKVGSESSVVKRLVFIVPIWVIIIFVLFILSLIFWLVSRSRSRKQSKLTSVNSEES